MKKLADGTIARVNTIVVVQNGTTSGNQGNTITKITHLNMFRIVIDNMVICEAISTKGWLPDTPIKTHKGITFFAEEITDLKRATSQQKALYWARKEIVPLLKSKQGNRYKQAIKLVRKKTGIYILEAKEFVDKTMKELKL